VVVLPLVVVDDRERQRVEKLFAAMHTLKRALQRDVRARLRAYWAAPRRLQRDAAGWREELGLSREQLERRAYRHLERSGWLLDHLTKALAMHQADEVWAGVSRHLFGDREGRRSGMPRVGGWWSLRRIAGRARSHTSERKWETFRLFGTLRGHLAAHRHPELPDEITTPTEAARLASGSRVLAQARRPRRPERPSSWWDYSGPLVLVFNGGPRSRAGDLVLPVRLPQGAGRWPHLVHFLDCPERWHKVDLVRRRDASAVGGWRYEAHLMVLGAGYRSPATQARLEAAGGLERVGGVDGNVSNLSVVSFPRSLSPADGEVASTRVVLSDEEKARLARERRQDRARQRALDRSRRSANARQYQPSVRQRRRAERRAAAGLAERQLSVAGGAREVDARGRPRQPYREDALSQGYRQQRAEQAQAAAGRAAARTHRARRWAAAIVAVHGPHLRIEEGSISAWFRRWGRSCLAFTPGRLISALERECAAAGGALLRVGTASTALSQHCLCGARVAKDLGQRVHTCPDCGLTGDRDLVSAALAAFTNLDGPGDPQSARVDYDLSRRALGAFGQRLQAAVAESTVLRPNRGATATRQTCSAKPRRAPARRNAGHCLLPTLIGSIVSPPGSHERNPGSPCPLRTEPLG
jgi:transposase